LTIPPPTPPPATPPLPASLPIDLMSYLPLIAKYYQSFHFILPILGIDLPPEAHKILMSIAKGEQPNMEEIQALKQNVDREIGEPVMTRQLAEEAYYLHEREGMGTREIAEYFTKQGSPMSHATVARYINMVDMEKRASKMGLVFRAIKWSFIGIIWGITLWVVHIFF